jgi:peptidoglycan-associated lipoprotein
MKRYLSLSSQIWFVACISLFLGVIRPANAQLKLYKQGLIRFEQGDYDLAIKDLLNVKDIANSEKGKLFYTIAEAYRLTNRLVDGNTFYEKAIASKFDNTEVRYHYAMGLKAQGQYEEAQKQLMLFLRTKGISKNYQQKANREIATLKSIEELSKKNAKEISINSLSQLNTAGAEFAPFVLNDEIIFTASRKKLIYTNGLPYIGLYKSAVNTTLKEIALPKEFSTNIYTEDRNEGTPTFSKDGKTMVFAKGNSGNRKDLTPDVDLYLSKFNGTNWSVPEMLAISDSAAWDGCPAFSTDGKSLYFASNRFGGQGGLDLWSAKFDAATYKFSKITNLGKVYNTNGNEMFPFADTDGKFYFASDGHPGLGRLDLFQANRQAGGKINIENLGQPFNSPADDFGLTIDKNGNMLFASDRTGGQGNDDIYLCSKKEFDDYVTQKKEDDRLKAEAIKAKTLADAIQKQIDLTPKVVNYFLAGTITANDAKKTPLEGTRVKILDDATGNVLKEITTGKNGRYGPVKIETDRDYTIVTDKEKFLTKRETFTMEGKEIAFEKLTKAITDTMYFANVSLDKIVLNKAFKVENIYYDLNKYDIREDAAIELDKLVLVLEDNPGIKIELGSHTDTRSSDVYNARLSQQRAQSAVNYIISRGIESNRMKAKGYGETQLIVKNAKTEEEHQINRRTEFKVVELADGTTEEEEDEEEN